MKYNCLSKEKIYLLVILFFPFLFFYKLIFFKQIIFGGDVSLQNYPMRVFNANTLVKGYLPFWCSNIFMGYPSFAEGQGGLFFPLNILYLYLPKLYYDNFLLLFSLGFLGITSFLLIYYFIKDFFSSFLSAITLMFSGVIFVHLTHINIIQTFMFFPLMILFYEKYLSSNKLIYAFISGLIIGVTGFAFHPPLFIKSIITLIIYVVINLINNNFQKEKIFKSLYFLSITIILTFLIPFMQLFPLWELSNNTVRSITANSLFVKQSTLTFKDIFFFYLQKNNLLYFNLLSLFIFILTLINFSKNKQVKKWLYFVILMFLLSFGLLIPLFLVLNKYFSLLNILRAHTEYLLFAVLGISMIVGYGYYNFVRNTSLEFSSKKNIFSLSLILVLFIISKFFISDFNKSSFIFLVLFLTNIIFLYSRSFFILRNYLFYVILIIFIINFATPLSFKKNFQPLNLTKNIGLVKTNMYNYYFKSSNSYKSAKSVASSIKKTDKSLFRILNHPLGPIPPNLNIIYGLDSIEGYSPLYLKNYADLSSILNDNVLTMCNVKYLIAPSLKLNSDNFLFDKKIKNYYLFKNKNTISRFKVYFKNIVVEDKSETLAMLKDISFPLNKVLILNQDPEIQSLKKNYQHKIQIIKYLPALYKLKVYTSKEAMLFISDTYYPGWQASINDNPTKIFLANYNFKAIKLNAGNNTVIFKFIPTNFFFFWKISSGIIFLYIIFLGRKIYELKTIT